MIRARTEKGCGVEKHPAGGAIRSRTMSPR